MKWIILIALIVLPSFADAQHKRMKKKDSFAQGTLFGYWGYNRSGYSNSNIRFAGPGYDFTLKGAAAKDNPSPFSTGVYLNPSQLTIPQYNVMIGYYFRDHWALSMGYDHMKYILRDRNEVLLSGTIDPGVDANWSGTYNAESIVTDRNQFHYENSDGLNYLRLELTRTDRVFAAGNNDWFAVSTNVGASMGGLLSFNDFNFGGNFDHRTISMSGYGMSLHANVRLEFLRHVFLQSGFSGGFHHQVRVNTRPNDPSSFARHAYGYGDFNTVLGFFIYIRSKNGCDSCPVW